MQIPIRNIYYLLCYAWNKLDERDRVAVSVDDTTELLDLFAKVLINSTKLLIKRGIDKSYVEHTEELAGVKGKIAICQTIKSNLLYKQRTICTYDDFTANNLSNRILVTTIHTMIRIRGLDKELKNELINLSKMLPGIIPIEITSPLFNQVRIHRNNQFYGFIMKVCQLIHENILPSETTGHFKFSDFTRDEQKMNKLFEEFVRNFYRVEQSRYPVVRIEHIQWKLTTTDRISKELLPQMRTDITLENDHEKIIIDAKYYRETLSEFYNSEKVRSVNLYQLFSYLMHQRDGSSKTATTTGILLYPTIDKEYNLNYNFEGHRIQVRTVNLNDHWSRIAERLKEVIGMNAQL